MFTEAAMRGALQAMLAGSIVMTGTVGAQTTTGVGADSSRPSPAARDTMRLPDSLARKLFDDTPGRLQFERHMGLGKGHFVSGSDLQKSGLVLSDFLATLDSIQLVPKVDQTLPVVPATGLQFLTTSVAHHCLNVRVDRTSLPQMLLLRQSDNIDELLPPDAISGIEVYLKPADVPLDLRSDAFPSMTALVARPGAGSYSMGVVGKYDLLVQRGSKLERPPLLPSCPFMQIWTRSAW